MAVSGVSYSNQIKALKVGPLDGKSLAPDFASLRNPDYWGDLDNGLPYIKNGMIFSTEDGHIYQLLDRTNYTSESAWKEIGVGGTGGTGENIDIDYYGKLAAIALYGVIDSDTFYDVNYNGIQGLFNAIKDYYSFNLFNVASGDVYRFSQFEINAYNIHLCCVPHNMYDLTSDVEIKITGKFANQDDLVINTVTCCPFTDINISEMILKNYPNFSDNYNLSSIDVFCNKPFILDNGVKSSGLLNWIEL